MMKKQNETKSINFYRGTDNYQNEPLGQGSPLWPRVGNSAGQRELMAEGDNSKRTNQSIMDKRHPFSARVFLCAGIYGLAVLLPQYFLEEKLGRDFPPRLTHPEHFYGFIGVALTWQFVFLIIAGNIQRYRLLMLPAIAEKLSFGAAALVLYAQSRIAPLVAGAGIIDLLFAILFVLAFRASRHAAINNETRPWKKLRVGL